MKKTFVLFGLAVFAAAGLFAQPAPPAPPAPPEPPDVLFQAIELPELPVLPELAALQGNTFFATFGEEGGEVQVPGGKQIIVARGGSYLGVGFKDIDAERAKELKMSEPLGVEITRVDPESPAVKAGLKEGDVVVEYNGQRVEGTEQFVRLVRETPPGRQVKLHIKRGGASQTLMATIVERPHKKIMVAEMREKAEQMQKDMMKLRMQLPDTPGTFMTWQTAVLGIEAESVSKQLAEFFGVKQGVLVRSVMKETPAEKAGLKAGDVITKVNGEDVTSPWQVSMVVRKMDPGKAFPVTVVRNRQELTLNAVIEAKPTSEAWPAKTIHRKQTTVRSVGTAGPML